MLENQIKELYQDRSNKLDEIEEHFAQDDFSFRVNCHYDSLNIEIRHTLNWTDFVTCYFRFGSRGQKFEFSHGSGGWNDAPATEILDATIAAFKLVKRIESETEFVTSVYEEISKIEIKAKQLSTQLELEKIKKLEEESQKILDNEYQKFTFEELNEALKDGGSLKLYFLNNGKIVSDIIGNMGCKRVSWYVSGESSNNKQVQDLFLNNEIYVKA